jgi:ATP-binding cassette subfamily F protein 3
MSSVDIGEEIRTALPGTEELVVQYVADYLVDDAGADEDVLAIAQRILASAARGQADAVAALMRTLGDMLADTLKARAAASARPTLTRLDKVVEMGKAAGMSGTLGLGGGAVDLESVNKGKCVAPAFPGRGCC